MRYDKHYLSTPIKHLNLIFYMITKEKLKTESIIFGIKALPCM